MTRNEQLATIIRLACDIEDRADDEQRALMAWAWDCDKAHNKNTVTNRARRGEEWEAQDLVSLVHSTRVLVNDEKPVPLPKNWDKQWAVWEREAGGL